MRLSEHFDSKEFACKCGCGFDTPVPSLIDALEDLRIALENHPITILSGCRCEAYNKKVGGTPDSKHVRGCAADIVAKGASLPYTFRHANLITELHHGGIGIYPERGFIHVDTRGMRARWGMLRGIYVPFTDAWAVALRMEGEANEVA